jgi:hypothetical protein
MVLSEKTMPQPKVLSAWLRSSHGDLGGRIGLLHQDREIQPGRAPPRHTMRIAFSFPTILPAFVLFYI